MIDAVGCLVSDQLYLETTMNLKHIIMTSIIGAALAGGSLFAQAPPDNINPQAHPNLAAAQQLIDQAYQKLTAAQQANHDDMQGHDAKAKELLTDAGHELKAAAEAADGHHTRAAGGHASPGTEPAVDVSERNPNLHEAQRLMHEAFNKITAAQDANKFDMQGHAEKAKDLLDHASQETKLAAEAADKR